jgi:hypothetical protein
VKFFQWKKGRIVQFQDDTFGYQKLRWGIFPVLQFLDLDEDDRWTWCDSPKNYCKTGELLKLREFVKELEKITNAGTIKKVIKESALNNALD